MLDRHGGEIEDVEAAESEIRFLTARVAVLEAAIEAMRVAGGSTEFQAAFDAVKAALAAKENNE